MIGIRRLRCGAACVAMVFVYSVLWAGTPAFALEADWTATLVPPAEGDAYKPSGPIAVQVPGEVGFEILVRLAFEVDAIDVTALLAFDNQTFTYRPPQALAPGAHKLRLVETAADGALVERGSWTIQVAGAPAGGAGGEEAPSNLSVSATNSLEISQRLAELALDTPPRRGSASGGGYGDLSYDDGPWSLTASGNYLVQSQQGLAPSGNQIDLGEYNFTGRYSGEDYVSQVALGHQDLGADNLIMSGFYSRGASLKLGTASESVNATAFGFRTDAITGASDFSGLSDRNNRLFGVTATAHPVPAWGQDFAVTGIYYRGKGGDLGIGGEGDDSATEAQGWGLVADSYWFDRKVQLKGQVARTSAKYADVLVGDEKATSNPWSALLAYAPLQGEQVGDDVMSLSFGARHEVIGTNFYSLVNSSMAADREATTLYSDFSWGGFSTNVQALHQTNNVDNLADIPTDRLTSLHITGNYYPLLDPPEDGSEHPLGQPYINFNLGGTKNRRVTTPSGYSGGGTDNYTRTAGIGVGSNYANWGWRFGETVTRYDDRAGISSDTDSYYTDIGANWSSGDRVQLDGGLQWGLFRTRDTNADSYNLNLTMGMQAVLIPEVLKTKLNYNLNLLAGDGDTPDNNLASGEVEWTLLPPENNRVGVALVLQGAWEDNNGNSDKSLDGSSWQVFSTLRLSAPLSN
jgi:hypothetical protein